MCAIPVDLRSDTLTQPSIEMRKIMSEAVVGDDVFGEDPTVRALEDYAAQLTGMERSLFVPSGTMGNLIAMLVHCNQGDEVIVGKNAHSMLYEAGGGGAVAGVQFQVVGERGHFAPSELSAAIRTTDPGNHLPNTRLVMVENTHNSGGGLVLSPEKFSEIYTVTQRHQIPIHIDGARIFNAAAASSCEVIRWTKLADSISFCLSKGLGAPVGSMLCGSSAFISKAHRFRKMLGGGMRQVGILAAAGLFALKFQREGLAVDNERAQEFAREIESIDQIRVRARDVQSNIVIFETLEEDAASLCARLSPVLKVLPMGARRVRAVFHRDVPTDVVERSAAAVWKAYS